MIEWIKTHQLVTAAGIACTGIWGAALLVVYMRPNYFSHKKRPTSARTKRFKRLAIRVGKNILGVLLVFVGVALFILPGPGIPVVLSGLFLIDFPGKYRFQRWLMSKPHVRESVNWLRNHFGQLPVS
jgi:hypothetical protein